MSKFTLQKVFILLFITLSLLPNPAHASPENDRVYQLESLAWVRAADNVDHIFADYLDEQFTKYFKKQSRFTITRLNGIDQILGNSSMPYAELIQNRDLMKKIAQHFRVENIIRTRVYKEAETYRFVMEWVYAPRGDVLSQFEFRYVDPQKEKGLEGSDLPRAIEHGLDELISKLPFLGQVTGVEGETITVNLGRNQNVQPGEIFVIGTIDSVRRHPILNTIEEWRWNKVGRAQVEQVEESICFAKIIETEPKETVIRFQKIREILPAPAEENHEKSSKSFEREIPRIGWVAGNLGIGNYSREVGAGSSTGRTGGGLLGAVELDSQFWLNSRWLGQASFSESLFHYGAQDIATSTNTATYGGHASQFRLAAGYSLFPAKTVFDSIAWILLGYRSTNYSLTQQSSDYTGSSTISSLFMGLGGEVPLDGGLTAQLGIDIGLFKSASADSLTSLSGWGTPDSVSDIMVTAGFTYHFEDQIFLRLLFKFNSQSIDFTGGTTGQTLSQKMFTLSPSIMYYF